MDFASILVIFFSSLLVGFTGALAPGPLLTVTVNESLRRGQGAGFWISFGHALLELAIVVALVQGLATLIKQSLVGGLIGFFGGAFLLWMGYNLLMDAWHDRLAIDAQNNRLYHFHPVVAGVVISLANPYWILWWMSTGAAFLMEGLKIGITGVAAFYLGHILADFIWYMSVSWAVVKGKKIIKDQVYKGVMIVCAALIGFFGLYFLFSGIKFLS